MPVNDPFAELMGFTSAKGNVMCVVAYTGAQIAALSATAIDGQVVYCYSTGSGFTRGHWYGWDDVIGYWADLSAVDYYEAVSSQKLVGIVDHRFGTRESYDFGNSGTSSSVTTVSQSSEWRINLVTGIQTTGVAYLYAGGPKLDFGKPAFFKGKFTVPSVTTGQVVKIGVGVDKAGQGPAVNKMFGIEWCDGDTDFQIHSANGTTQSNTDTTRAVTAGATYGVEISFVPGTAINVTIDDGTTITTHQKVTHVPSSGGSLESDLMHISISNNNGSSTSKTFGWKAGFLVYNILDSQWQ